MMGSGMGSGLKVPTLVYANIDIFERKKCKMLIHNLTDETESEVMQRPNTHWIGLHPQAS